MMLTSNGKCQYERKYTATERVFREKSKAQERMYTIESFEMMQRCDSDFFPENTLGDGPAFWIYLPGFTDKS